MAELFEKEFSFTTSYIKGDGGILEVKSGNQVIWTNRDNRGYKPSNEEALSAMKAFLDQK